MLTPAFPATLEGPGTGAERAVVALRRGTRVCCLAGGRCDAFHKVVHETVGEVVGTSSRRGVSCLDVEFYGGQVACLVRNAPAVGFVEASLQETGPDAPGAEEWILANKARFKKRYGKAWKSRLYGHAWKLYGDKAVNKKLGEAAVSLDAGGGEKVLVTVSGSPGDGRVALGVIHQALAGAGYKPVWEDPDGIEPGPALYNNTADLGAPPDLEVDNVFDNVDTPENKPKGHMFSAPDPGQEKLFDNVDAVVPEPVVYALRYETAAEQDAFLDEASGDLKGRRSLTTEEEGKLRVPKDKLECSVGFVPGRGYVAWTHRARSKFYDCPSKIPARALKFIGSTG
jgi:hypothetical protein